MFSAFRETEERWEITPPAMAEGIRLALSTEDAARRATAAKIMADKKYTFQAYLERMERCLEMARGNRQS